MIINIIFVYTLLLRDGPASGKNMRYRLTRPLISACNPMKFYGNWNWTKLPRLTNWFDCKKVFKANAVTTEPCTGYSRSQIEF